MLEYKRIKFKNTEEKIVSDSTYNASIKILDLETQIRELQFQISVLERDYSDTKELIPMIRSKSIDYVIDVNNHINSND